MPFLDGQTFSDAVKPVDDRQSIVAARELCALGDEEPGGGPFDLGAEDYSR
jgi:hypothetical protein